MPDCLAAAERKRNARHSACRAAVHRCAREVRVEMRQRALYTATATNRACVRVLHASIHARYQPASIPTYDERSRQMNPMARWREWEVCGAAAAAERDVKSAQDAFMRILIANLFRSAQMHEFCAAAPQMLHFVFSRLTDVARHQAHIAVSTCDTLLLCPRRLLNARYAECRKRKERAQRAGC